MSRIQQADVEQESRTAKQIERHTTQLPTDMFLWAAGVSIAGALALRLIGRSGDAQFVGQWAPTFLILGVYNKLVKMFSSR